MKTYNIMNDNEYVLVFWSDSQELMEEEWFESECFLANPINEEQEWVGSSAYFVPKKRLEAE